MKTCLLLERAPETLHPDDQTVTLLWEGTASADSVRALGAYVQEHLLPLRKEHLEWACDFGEISIDGRSLADHLPLHEGQPLSMWWCSLLYERHPKMTPDLFSIYRLRALEQILTEEGCTDLILEGQDATLIRVLQVFCTATGRTFSVRRVSLPGKKESWVRRIYTSLPPRIRAVLRFLLWLWKIRRPLPMATLAPVPQKTAVVVTYFPNIDQKQAAEGRFRSRYFESLHDAISARAGQEGAPFVRWLFIPFPSPDLSFRECCRLKERFAAEQKDGVSFNYLEEFLGKREILQAVQDYRFLARESARLLPGLAEHFHFAGSRMNFFPYAEKDYRESFQGWRALERCLQNAAFHAFVRQCPPQRWFLFPLENCPWERMLISAVRQHQCGPVYGAQHSTIRPTDLRYFDDPRVFRKPDTVPTVDLLLSNGTSSCRQWTGAGVPGDRLRIVEALRYLYLAGRERIPPSPRRQLLVLTSFFHDETAAHLALFNEAFSQGLLADLSIVIKPHPYLAVDRFLPRSSAITIGKGPLRDFFRPGVLVWASNSTTAALEAAIMGLPLAVMQPVDDFDLCPIQDIPHLLRTATIDDVKAMLALTEGVSVPEDYIRLDPALPTWKALLGLD